MSEQKVEPALSAEEWAYDGGPQRIEDSGDTLEATAAVFHNRPHALAALCLYGQPYGFTREDIALLELWATAEESAADALPGDGLINAPPWWPKGVPSTCRERSKMTRSLAARIRALLPPEDKTP